MVATLSCRERAVAPLRDVFSGVGFGRVFSSPVRPRSWTSLDDREW